MLITETEIKEMVNKVISLIKEGYLYHRGAGLDMNNPEPYHSEGRVQKWEGAGHETGSFGSGTYFTSIDPRDGNLSDDDKRLARGSYGVEGRFIRLKGDNGEGGWRNRSGLYRVDTSFYSNLYQLKSEKEGDLLKALMNGINGYVSYCDELNYDDGSGRDYKYIYMRERQNRYLKLTNLAKTLGLNFPWNYREFYKFAQEYKANTNIRQTPATIFMEKNGYNGVDATYGGKYDSYWEGSVIYDLNKVKGEIKPVKNPRDEFKLHNYDKSFSRDMYTDILNGRSDPQYFKDGEYGGEADDSSKILAALKRYPMVLSANKFWALPEDIKGKYLRILLTNIQRGFINIKDPYNWYKTDGMRELQNDAYIRAICENGVVDYVNLNDRLASNIYYELSKDWKYEDKNMIMSFINAYKGNSEDVFEEIKYTKEMNDLS